MPLLARTFVKAGFIYLAAALMVNVLTAALPAWSPLSPVYIHLLMLGWVTQVIMGVAYWMFPKQSKATPRGSDVLGWLTFGALNIGLVLRALTEPMRAWVVEWSWGGILVLSAVLQAGAAWLFIINTWRRVKER